MFSAWNFHSWITSVGAVLFMCSLITGFGLLVTLLISRIWGEEGEVAAAPRVSGTAKKSPIREAA
jgi:hypothetical protein